MITGTVGVEMPKRQVSSQMGRISSLLEKLDTVVSQLGDKILPIRQGSPSKPEEKSPSPTLCPLAEDLHHRAESLSIGIDRLSAMIEEIEL